ncbi:MAG: flavodoxin [Clostridia bacterium]|nr:flavodoxin [Clostridia bacterium]
MNNSLLVYFSYNGNTKMIADYILNKINCDVLELKPKIKYSDDYQSVVDEYQNNETAKSTTKLEDYKIDIDKYEKVIIGSPVWWYTITPVIRTFLKDNDLSGKTIITFATNAGWLGRTFKEIKELCPNSTIKNEMNIVFTTNHKEHKLKTEYKEIDEWIEKIK